MIHAVDRYLAVRRAAGFALENAGYLLRSFARFARERCERFVRTTTAIAWASQSRSVAQRDERLKTVCRFARYLHAEDPQHEVPPAAHFGYRKTRRVPYIYSQGEIQALLGAARQLGPADAVGPRTTYVTLLGLLAATGLRVSEALALQPADVTPQGLLIRKTKFQKTRLVPLHATVAAALARYLACRRRPRSPREPIFLAADGRPLQYGDVYRTFRTLVRTAGLLPPSGRYPRLHDLRHSFAVRALEAGPAGRQRIGQHMVALATYLGHVNIYSTYWYLDTTPDLLRDIAAAGEAFYSEGSHDPNRPPYRGIPAGPSRPTARRQPAHL